MIASRRPAWIRWRGVNFLLLLQVFLFAAAVPALVRLKLARLQWLLGRVPVGRREDPARVQAILRCMTIALRRGRPLVRSGCLTRGVTLYYFLRRAGLDVDLCFGAGHLDDEFAAHCWLERDGEPFQETGDPRKIFAEMYRLPGGAPRSTGTVQSAGLPR
jgi:Transglutaminase-like superfamily